VTRISVSACCCKSSVTSQLLVYTVSIQSQLVTTHPPLLPLPLPLSVTLRLTTTATQLQRQLLLLLVTRQLLQPLKSTILLNYLRLEGAISSSWETHLKTTKNPIQMGSHSVTCHLTQVNAPRLNPSQQASTRVTYPEGLKGWKADTTTTITTTIYITAAAATTTTSTTALF